MGYRLFDGCSKLSSITVYDGNPKYHSDGDCLIETASKKLIAGCNSSIIPADGSVTEIDYYAFYHRGIVNLTIPSSVKKIKSYAFVGCADLSSITVAYGNTVYHSAGNCLIETASKTLIAGCKNSVIPIDGSVTRIGDCAFQDSGLTSITIPNSITFIAGSAGGCTAFIGCRGLTSINVASGNTRYHSSGNCLIETSSKTLLVGCKNSVIPTDGSVTSVGDYAFYGVEITTLTISSGVTSIGYEAFSNCVKLSRVTLSGIKIIEDKAFNGCSSLTNVAISKGTTSIGNQAFAECGKLSSLTMSDVTSIGEYAFYNCSSLTSVTIPRGVTSIGWGAFYNCANMTKIMIPNGVTVIGESAFAGCTKLTIYCEEKSQPSGWKFNWNPLSRPIRYGYNM